MGTAAAAAEDTLDFEPEVCAIRLDMAVVGTIADH